MEMADAASGHDGVVNDPDGFLGAKVALFVGEQLVVMLRDEDRDIVWPGWWDFPGGGREGDETPEEVVIREIFEEVGLRIAASDLRGKRAYLTSTGQRTYFFGAHLPADAHTQIRFGGEGQCWALWSVEDYLAHPRGIPHFKARLETYLALGDHEL